MMNGDQSLKSYQNGLHDKHGAPERQEMGGEVPK
jgi:hypothetical protein